MEFVIGCNYWASNAGTEMWKEWDERIVRDDLKVLSDNGMRYLRVFPNWRDFQPIIPICTGGNFVKEYRLEGDVIPHNEYYLDETMIQRFSSFCDICEEYNIKIIVGLITGWMSGRMFVPAALFNKNLYSDSVAIMFEQRFIKGMVKLFSDKKAICAWDIGNECNALDYVKDEWTAISWTAAMSNAIRANDHSRPVISSVHQLAAQRGGYAWTIDGEAESCDILVSHPYPLWSKYGYKDYTASFRTMIHGVCESKYYSDLSNKPCLMEEIGTMGPMICTDETAADFMRVNTFSAWANSLSGIMWWCANEQTNLNTDPYTDNMCETELGMIDSKRNPKPVLKETKRIAKILSEFNFKLPKADTDAVCILTKTQDHWATAYMTYGLALQAGLSIKFTRSTDKLPQCDTYMMPSVCGNNIMPKEKYTELKERVADGATLYISNNNGVFTGFKELCGLEIIDSGKFNDNLKVQYNSGEITFERNVRYNMRSVGAEVIAYDSMGIPAITVNSYGKGKVYYVNFPLESMLIDKNEVFDKDYYKVYEGIFKDKIDAHVVGIDNKDIGMTYHADNNGNTYCVAINYSSKEHRLELKLKDGYSIDVMYGDMNIIKPFETSVFKLNINK